MFLSQPSFLFPFGRKAYPSLSVNSSQIQHCYVNPVIFVREIDPKASSLTPLFTSGWDNATDVWEAQEAYLREGHSYRKCLRTVLVGSSLTVYHKTDVGCFLRPKQPLTIKYTQCPLSSAEQDLRAAPGHQECDHGNHLLLSLSGKRVPSYHLSVSLYPFHLSLPHKCSCKKKVVTMIMLHLRKMENGTGLLLLYLEVSET